jgi:hypothetical protein
MQRGQTGCGKTLPCCHSESFAVILSAAKDLALPAQDKLREESRSTHFHGNMRFFVRYAQDRLRLLRMTVPTGSSAASRGGTPGRWYEPAMPLP